VTLAASLWSQLCWQTMADQHSAGLLQKEKSTIIRNESMLQNVRERMKFTRQNRNIKYSTMIIFPKAKKDLLIESEVGKIQK